jgi:hypothetical protein
MPLLITAKFVRRACIEKFQKLENPKFSGISALSLFKIQKAFEISSLSEKKLFRNPLISKISRRSFE